MLCSLLHPAQGQQFRGGLEDSWAWNNQKKKIELLKAMKNLESLCPEC